MSAYVCSEEQFKVLAIFAVRKSDRYMNVDPRYVDGAKDVAGQQDHVIATRYAAILLAENVRSVRYRYPDDIGDYEEIRISAREVLNTPSFKPVEILKLCASLNYQSCETDDWQTTKAYDLLQQIKDAAIQLLPGYEEARWSIYELSSN